jgi:hypothetical protein
VPHKRPVNLAGHQFNPPKMEVSAHAKQSDKANRTGTVASRP